MLPDGFGDYIAYADESGDPSLAHVDVNFPVFALAFCIFPIDSYVEKVVPAVQRLKFDFFGHDQVILHANDIRKKNGPFRILGDDSLNDLFMNRVSSIIQEIDIAIIGSVVRKDVLAEQSGKDADPYEVAMRSCLMRLRQFLGDSEQRKTTRIIAESRGRKEDEMAYEAFVQAEVEASRGSSGSARLDLIFADKKVSSAGLQIADLCARPLAMPIVQPNQPGRAFDVVRSRIARHPVSGAAGWGVEVLP